MTEQLNGQKNGKRPKPPSPAVRPLGPVPNLEDHVPPDWWRRIFNSVYLKTDSDVVGDPNITRNEVDLFISTLNLQQPDARVLDLCCGQGRHTFELASRGFMNVEGFDRSHYLIQKARATARSSNLRAKFREGDARKLPYNPDSFDFVLMLGNSFGYFETVHDDARVLREIFRVLRPSGRLLIDVADGEWLRANYEPRSWEWLDKKHFVCRERTLSADGQRMISREVVTHVEKGVIADQFYAERLYTREHLAGLLSAAGLSDVQFDAEIKTDSARNQDLGMMGRRIIATATVRKDWAVQRLKASGALRQVVVIQGDPDRPDRLKPDARFDKDDIETIDTLKSALQQIEGYHFTYLDKHATLIDDLRRLKPKIDYAFNLCDEGFNNEARKELHVPALLEQIGIPYTGGNPQCLAYCYDKALVRGIAEQLGVPVPRAIFVKPEDTTFDMKLSLPVIVKPNFGDSSFGITQRSVANDHGELLNAISDIRTRFGYEKPILVEEFLTGDDLSIGILGNPPTSYTVLPITREDYSAVPADLPKICGYEAKWQPDSPYWNIKSVRAELPAKTEEDIVELSLRLFERLECRDYARLDWRLDSRGRPRLLEVNPNPGWCWDGHLAKMAALGGMSYSDLLANILRAAERRIASDPAFAGVFLSSDATARPAVAG
ncbi:MAG: methyltransferase domain-containing protein [Chloroflexi bacterium]|nr:methyltransferase domain-containing protein [Chloroflexota bacterium]